MVSSEMRGSIEAGKYADLVIWDRDPLEVSVEGLSEVIVETTLLAWSSLLQNLSLLKDPLGKYQCFHEFVSGGALEFNV